MTNRNVDLLLFLHLFYFKSRPVTKNVDRQTDNSLLLGFNSLRGLVCMSVRPHFRCPGLTFKLELIQQK